MAILFTTLPVSNAEKGVPGGVATLDAETGYIPLSQIDPSIGGQGDVISVNGLDPDNTGNVNITTTDIPEGNKLYYTEERVQDVVDTSLVAVVQSVNQLNLELQSEITQREGNDGAQVLRIEALENDHVTVAQYNDHESRIDTLETDLPVETQARIDDVADLQDQIDAEILARTAADSALDARIDDVELHHIHSNSYYANDGVSDIQTEINSVGSQQGQIVWVSSGSFGGADVEITNKVNMALIAPDSGGTICELAEGRGITISGTSERIRIANLQIEGAFTITGGKGRHVFTDCEFLGGVTIDGVTDTSATFITFEDCAFANQNINLLNLSNCIVYFNRCSFNNRRVITTNCTTTPYVGIIAEGSLLNTLQTQFSGGIAIAGRNDYSNGVVKVYSTSSNFMSALGVETAFTGSYTELRDKPTLVTASTGLSDSASLLRTTDKGIANGVAELDSNGLIPSHHLPPLALTTPHVVNTIAERDALTGIDTGDIAIVTNDTTPSNNGNYVYDASGPSWVKLYSADSPVNSVNGQTGVITLNTGDIAEGVGANSEPSQLFFTDQRAIDAVVTSNINTDDLAPSTQTVKTYVTGITDALDTRLDSVETDALTHATITYVDNGLAGKLDSSTYTAADILTKLKTVDGHTSGLDADLLDGLNSLEFVKIETSQTITGDKEFSGTLTAVTQTFGDDSTKVATTAFVQDAIADFTSVDGIRTAVGLDGTDSWSLPTSNYLAGASVITGALSTLDAQVYSANTVNSSQNTALGLANNGTKTDFASTYYVVGNSSFKTAIEALDAGLNTVANASTTINALSDIDNVNVSENLADDGKFLKWDNGTSKWIADSVPAGYSDNDAKDAVGAMLEAGTGDVTFTYDELNRTISTSVSVVGGVTSVNGDSGPTVVLDGNEIDSTHTSVHYLASTNKIDSHLSGIDTALGLRALLTTNTFTGDQMYDASYTLSTSDDSKKFATTSFVVSKLGSLSGALRYRDVYDADTATPSLSNAVIGDVYAVSVAGSLDSYPLTVGDLIIFKENVVGGVVYQNDFNVIHQEVAVSSVQGRTGAVVVSGNEINANYNPTNYTVTGTTLDKHFTGINTKLGSIVTEDGTNTFTGATTFTSSVTGTSSSSLDFSVASSVTVPNAGLTYTTSDSKVVNRTYLNNLIGSRLLEISNNLSELSSTASSARTNLGLGTAATYAAGTTNGTIPVLGASGLPAVSGVNLTALGSIDTLSDVAISSPTSNQVLTYNGTNWVNSASSGATRPRIIAISGSGTNTPVAVLSTDIEVFYTVGNVGILTIDLTNIPAQGNGGLKLTFKHTSNASVVIVPKSGETIDGNALGIDLINTYSSITLFSGNSTVWHVI